MLPRSSHCCWSSPFLGYEAEPPETGGGPVKTVMVFGLRLVDMPPRELVTIGPQLLEAEDLRDFTASLLECLYTEPRRIELAKECRLRRCTRVDS